jgi:putative FmdB family regulatory protein
VPLYEYECPKDGVFERMQKFSDAPLSACPTCGGPVEKLLSAPAIQFKGTGWYITDYARKGGEGKGKAEKAEKAESKDTKDTGGSKSTEASPSSTPTSPTSTDKK